jgi:AmiR/NasT family two-component response regulator
MGKTEDDAYAQLRAMAMAWRVSFEAAAERVVAAQRPMRAEGNRDD